jgi:hypothetical protein
MHDIRERVHLGSDMARNCRAHRVAKNEGEEKHDYGGYAQP